MTFKHDDAIVHPELKKILKGMPIQRFAIDPVFRNAVDMVNKGLWSLNNNTLKIFIFDNMKPEHFECQKSLFEGDNWFPELARQLEDTETMKMLAAAQEIAKGLFSESCLVCGHPDSDHTTHPEEERIYCRKCKKNCVGDEEESAFGVQDDPHPFA